MLCVFFTKIFHVAVRLFSNRSDLTSKCGKNKKVAHKAQLSDSLMFLSLFAFLCHITVLTHVNMESTWRIFFRGNRIFVRKTKRESAVANRVRGGGGALYINCQLFASEREDHKNITELNQILPTHTHTHTPPPPRDKNGQSLKNYITMAESRVWLSGLNNKLHLSYQQFAPSIHSTTLEWGETIQRLYQCSRYRIHLLSECNSTKETDNTTTLENHKF